VRHPRRIDVRQMAAPASHKRHRRPIFIDSDEDEEVVIAPPVRACGAPARAALRACVSTP
jgi:hypothetical protein